MPAGLRRRPGAAGRCARSHPGPQVAHGGTPPALSPRAFPCPEDFPVRAVSGRSGKAPCALALLCSHCQRLQPRGGCSPRAGARRLPALPSARPLGPGSAAAVFLALPAAGLLHRHQQLSERGRTRRRRCAARAPPHSGGAAGSYSGSHSHRAPVSLFLPPHHAGKEQKSPPLRLIALEERAAQAGLPARAAGLAPAPPITHSDRHKTTLGETPRRCALLTLLPARRRPLPASPATSVAASGPAARSMPLPHGRSGRTSPPGSAGRRGGAAAGGGGGRAGGGASGARGCPGGRRRRTRLPGAGTVGAWRRAGSRHGTALGRLSAYLDRTEANVRCVPGALRVGSRQACSLGGDLPSHAAKCHDGVFITAPRRVAQGLGDRGCCVEARAALL